MKPFTTPSSRTRRMKRLRLPFTPATDNPSSSITLSVEIWTLDDQQAANVSVACVEDPVVADASITQFALLAHPYGRLGGSSRDPVITCLASYLVDRNWMVVLFDARGVGNSTGRTSWTTVPETEDFQAILDQLLKPIILRSTLQSAGSASSTKTLTLLRAGYSHGALVASASTPIILPDSAPKLQTPLLLISYPVSYIWFLTSFHASRFQAAFQTQLTSTAYKVLFVYGDKDQFTHQKAYRRWISRLKQVLSPDLQHANRLSIVELSDTDHFWDGKYSMLCQLIGTWLESPSDM
ncbi:hypothetical protein CROQUDRAFT_653843 [Cronartium quercuum f. sp. fusiforme G11]|uniref:Uncharacterized protein n=1 Tax=Cronartium quercuum f. sp. fusiforme G11 TaxID=708437 RepID=A0A9P6NTN0_9BASI|nr:hypothetical protein CROQUDRAFT_653843 [Cronartium quercuum f. sp. fusiforme G11]